jgi:hypothetical protein
MIELLLVVVGAVVGAVATWLLPNREAQELRKQLAEPQARETEFRRRIGVSVRGHIQEQDPDHQILVLEANEEIEVRQLDYCIDTGARIESQAFEPIPRGHTVQLLLLGQEHLVRLQAAKYDGRTGTAEVRFRALYKALGEEREAEIPARLIQAYRDTQGTKGYLKVAG